MLFFVRKICFVKMNLLNVMIMIIILLIFEVYARTQTMRRSQPGNPHLLQLMISSSKCKEVQVILFKVCELKPKCYSFLCCVHLEVTGSESLCENRSSDSCHQGSGYCYLLGLLRHTHKQLFFQV